MSNNHPLTIVIFGGTGDLAQNKLIPAFFNLYKNNLLPKEFRIVGFSRKEKSHEEFRSFMKDSLESHKIVEEPYVTDFISHGYYQRGDINSLDSYKDLSKILVDVDEEIKVCSRKMFYLAVPPNLYESVFINLSESGLTIPCKVHDDDNSWTRVLVEKPFGEDSDQAEKLDMLLGKLFKEDQIFRIDHYLAKEALQNIITFRFANSVFEPIWNHKEIEQVSIKLYEEFGIRERGAFYDGIGALRDVGQNHILQMLALIAMDDPKDMSAESIRKSRADILEKTKLANKDFSKCVVRGQYVGYKDVNGVESDSTTETYFKIHLEIAKDRWNGTPFYLESGKALDKSGTEIEIIFKEKESCVCPPEGDHKSHKNRIVFSIQPDTGIELHFWSKKPGFKYELEERTLSFDYDINKDGMLPDAYQRILNDAIIGDRTLFISTEEVKAEWNVISPIIHSWDEIPLIEYQQGSNPKDIKN